MHSSYLAYDLTLTFINIGMNNCNPFFASDILCSVYSYFLKSKSWFIQIFQNQNLSLFKFLKIKISVYSNFLE